MIEEAEIETLFAETPIVIDTGTGRTKCGFADQVKPRIFPSVIGRPCHFGVMVGMGQRDYYIGEEAESKRGILRFSPVVQKTRIVTQYNVEKIWHHCFYTECRVAPEEHLLVFTTPPTTSDQSLRRTVASFFE